MGPTGANRSIVSDNVSSDWFSCAVSTPPVLEASSPGASVSARYGEPARDTGITSVEASLYATAGLEGEHPLVEQSPGADVAVVCDPSRTSPTTNDTSALIGLQRDVGDQPTFTPDTSTSLPATRPPAW